MMKKSKPSQFAILGLGRFGLSLVQTLSEYDVNIMACDKDSTRLHEAAPYATHLVQLDISDETAIEKMGLGNFDVVIMAMGADFEASQMAAMVAKEQGAVFVMVKARNHRQKKILESIGVDQVVLPEHEIGEKIARQLVGYNIIDILDESEHFSIKEMQPRPEWVGKSIQQSEIRKKHGLNVLGVRQGGKLIIPVAPTCVLHEKDILIVLTEHGMD